MKALLGLRAQVALLVLAVTACLFSLLGAVGFLQIAHSGRDAIHQRVATVVDILAAQLRAGTHTVRLATPDGVVATVIGATPPTDIPAGHEITVQRTITISGTTIRLEGQASDVALADSLHSLHTALWIGIPIAAILSAVLAGYAAHRALRPVAGITRQVEQIGPTDTTSRVPVPATGDEIDHLAGTVNSMLDRIAAGRLTQQRFTSDAAHELRTPLMALQGEIELARAHTISTDDAFLARTETLTSRLASRVDDLILLSTLDEAPPLTRAPTNVTELVHTEAAAMPKPIDVIGGPDISADIDHNLIARAVRNLLVNACRHAQHVTATVINEDDAVIIRIDDDGPGIDPTQRERIFQRFARTDDARDTETGGAGLGLAIVSSIANAHHGHTTITTSPHGGARFTLTLPRDQNAPSPQNS